VAPVFEDTHNANHAVKNQESLDSSQLFTFIATVQDDFFSSNATSSEKYELKAKQFFQKNTFIHWLENIKQKKAIMAHPSVVFKYEEDMNDAIFAAYANKIIFQHEDTLVFNFLNQKEETYLSIYKLEENYQTTFWGKNKIEKSYHTILASSLESGFYKFTFINQKDTFSVPIIINENKRHEVAILAPVTTWHAYNTFGGKSFYKNGIDSTDVNFIYTQRPINAIHFDSVFLGHDIFILKNIFDWFNKNKTANIYPDYFLEAYPALFANYKTIVLAQHCEYFSPSMYQNLKKIASQTSVLALGGNQIYWKVKWHNNFTELEVRKDGTFFENTNFPGGLWRNNYFSEANLLGGAYSDAGYGTYYPYTVLENDHWIFEGLALSKGAIFGEKGIDGRGLSGDEMDKRTIGTPSNAVLLAKGNNPNNGGGEIILIERNEVAILSCGSIACGSGLGLDSVFTKMIGNFMERLNK
jgi:hypothetical protein